MAVSMTLKEYLDNAGVHYNLVEHPYAVSSSRVANEAHVSSENLAKAVVLRDGDGYILAVVPATHHVQLGRLRKHFNRYIVLASEEDLHDLFQDCEVGAIPPVGDAYGVDVIFDSSLYECEDVYFEAGDHTDLIHVRGTDFRMLMGNARHGEISQHI